MDLGLQGKIAIVCAASKGLGRACATALAHEGANVVICARNEQALNDTAQAIRAETGVRVLPMVCDLTSGADIEQLVTRTVEEFGTVDILITNVGHPQMGAFFDLSEDDWQRGYDGILLPVIRLCGLVIPHMQKASWGRIVHITSVAVKEPGTPYLISSTFRAGVAALSKSLANEFGKSGILVNTVSPGAFRTPLGEALIRQAADRQSKSIAEAESETANATVIGRIGEAEELAALVAFLCSDRASDITGQVMTVDGGMVRGLL
ncbi:MAG: SDR family oxidoreductase [Candidatus Poribacteria bacterium]|nr:SDR family oxidoreductase [Candidatus Poribacteria bacterium]